MTTSLLMPDVVDAQPYGGGATIAQAPEVPVGSMQTGFETAQNVLFWNGAAEFWRLNLQTGDQVTVDYGRIDAQGNTPGVEVALFNPGITDYTVSETHPDAWDSAGSDKHELKYTANSTGEWTIEVSASGCCGNLAYELTVYVKTAQPAVKPVAKTTANPDCADYYILDSRGSGKPENQLSPPGAAFATAWQQKHPGKTVQTWPNPYPAVGLPEAATAPLTGGVTYGESVTLGQQALKAKIKVFEVGCPKARIYLTGYSQGAEVAGDAYQAGVGIQVAGVVLFGDPKFNSADTWADRGSFAQTGQRLNGVHNPRPEFVGGGKVLSFCIVNDWACQKSVVNFALHRNQHNLYGSNGYAVEAVSYFAARS